MGAHMDTRLCVLLLLTLGASVAAETPADAVVPEDGDFLPVTSVSSKVDSGLEEVAEGLHGLPASLKANLAALGVTKFKRDVEPPAEFEAEKDVGPNSSSDLKQRMRSNSIQLHKIRKKLAAHKPATKKITPTGLVGASNSDLSNVITNGVTRKNGHLDADGLLNMKEKTKKVTKKALKSAPKKKEHSAPTPKKKVHSAASKNWQGLSTAAFGIALCAALA